MEDTGGIDVTCSLVGGGGSGGRLVPIAPGPIPGVIPAAHVTNKCCFGIVAPTSPGPSLGWLEAVASTCDPAYSECYPGAGDELLYVLQSDGGTEPSTETIYLWSLGGPGCGLVGLEAIAVLVVARAIRRRRNAAVREEDA